MEIVIAPDPRLRIKTKPVKKISAELLKTIKEMVDLTKTFTDPEGVGLASTQVGNSEQYFVMKLNNGDFKAIFNPQILSSGKRQKTFFEGCLSIPDYYAEVKRPTTVKVKYLSKDGKEVIESLKGIEAWVFQHEFDHINGKLFMDLAIEQKARVFRVKGRDRAGSEIFEEIKL